MKKIRKLLYFLAALLALFGIFLIICTINPDVTEAIAGLLYPDQRQTGTAGQIEPDRRNISDSPQNNGIGNGGQIQPADQLEAPEGNHPQMPGEGAEESGNSMIGDDVVSDYTPPEQSEIIVPDDMAGRTGYQQIQDEREEIDEDTAEQLQNQLDNGYTGDDLDFDARFYPYYAMLDDTGKHLYRQIYANANALYPVFAPVEQVSMGQLRDVFSAVYNDHPELFWMETAYAGKFVGNGRCVEIDLKFNRTAQDLDTAKAVFNENANQVLSGAQNLSGNYEKEKYVHDALLDRISYNLGAEMNQSAYSALVNGQTVCAGYARAFQYLMQQLGIPCYYCTGYAGESHAWNIVELDGEYYNVDTTWDDSGQGKYDYFNKTDEDYASNHMRQELSVYLPPCNGQTYRNLEQGEEESNLRSLADVGISEEQVLTTMQQYYDDCYNQMVQNGIGSYTFYNVIEGEALLDQWKQEYQYENYRQAYMENALRETGGYSCDMSLDIEELQGGRYLISHETNLW